MVGSPTIASLGGGLYTADSFNPGAAVAATVIHTLISGNSPDQCVGC
jgi:hypothetical protein